VVEAAGLVLALAGSAGPRAAALVGGLAVAGAGAAFLPELTRADVWSPRAVHLQQAQMARFARDVLKAPVAVNDVGRVAWGNDHYVLDLWGLVSAEARHVRLAPVPPAQGWGGPLAAEHGVEAAMFYNYWLGKSVAPDWVALADLTMRPGRGAFGGYDVTFYATGPQYVAPVAAALKRFAPTLPKGARLTLIGPAAK
jgi:hypothetical protein